MNKVDIVIIATLLFFGGFSYFLMVFFYKALIKIALKFGDQKEKNELILTSFKFIQGILVVLMMIIVIISFGIFIQEGITRAHAVYIAPLFVGSLLGYLRVRILDKKHK